MSKFYLPCCLTAVLLVLSAVDVVDAKKPKSDGAPCAQKTLERIESRSGSFEIVSGPLMDAPVAQPATLRIGQAIHIDRALLSQIAAPSAEKGR